MSEQNIILKIVMPHTNFAEMYQEEILCIVRIVNKTNCANDPFNLRKMSSEIIWDPITTIFTDINNSSFSTGVFPDTEKYAVVRPLLKAGKDREELSSYWPLYNRVGRNCLSFHQVSNFTNAGWNSVDTSYKRNTA